MQHRRFQAVFAIRPMTFIFMIAAFGACSHKTVSHRSPFGPEPIFPEEFHERNGLPNFFTKVKRGDTVRVAYIGGSITESNNGWRDLTYNWLRINYPQSPFYQINATIGGTGSRLGVFRMEQDVLAHKPDLLFVEFAVNDSGDPAASIYRTIEGIVRKTWRSNPFTDIIFVYTIAGNLMDSLTKGSIHPAARAMEKIAEHYRIPSIHMGVEVARLHHQGKLVMMEDTSARSGKIVFSRDNVHPLIESGQPIYANVVMKYMQSMALTGNGRSSRPHALSSPFVADNLEDAQMVYLTDYTASSNWEKLPESHDLLRRFSKFMPAIYKARSPSAALTIRFKGSTLGFYDVIGPGTGIIDLEVDGKRKEFFRFDPYCVTFRKHNFFVDSLTNSVHEVTIRVSGKPLDKAAMLLKRNKNLPNGYPQAFSENDWYLSNILVAGEVLSVNMK